MQWRWNSFSPFPWRLISWQIPSLLALLNLDQSGVVDDADKDRYMCLGMTIIDLLGMIRFQGEKITFHEESFVISRPVGLQPFLRNVLQLQIFRQFVEERLQMLNDGKGFTDPFEREAARFSETMLYGGAGGVSGPALQQKITKSAAAIGNSVKKEGGAFVQAVKNKVKEELIFF